MMKRLPIILLAIAVIALALFGYSTPPSASANAISEGFDFFQTTEATSVDLSSAGLSSDVPLEGNPVGGALGNTDTIVLRKEPIDPLTFTGDISAEFKDTNPDTVVRTTGSWITDGFVAAGTFTVSGTVSNDGTYLIDSVTALVLTLDSGETLTNEGPLTANFDSSSGGDVLTSTGADRITLSGTGDWQHARPDGYPVDAAYPAGDFYATLLEHVGPHAVETSIGGIAEVLAGGPHSPASASGGSGSSALTYAGLTGAVAAGMLVVTAGGWYARRRFRQ